MLRFDREIKGTRDSDHYATPKCLYRQLNQEFSFSFDPCPLRCSFNGLALPWYGNIYVNPPYSNIEPFIRKGITELDLGRAKAVVFLLPVRSDTRYWHELILPGANELRFIKGRLNFNESKCPAPFPSVLIVFRQPPGPLKVSTYFISKAAVQNRQSQQHENQF
jgi:hypothetical protein